MASIGLQHLANMCRQIGVSLRAGLDIRKVWEHEANRGSHGHRHRAQRVLDQVGSGETLAIAMRSVSPYFPQMTCDLVDVGEKSGRLEEVFLKLADHYDSLIKLRRQFLGDIAWPAIQLGLAILVIGGMIWLMSILPPEPIPVLGFSGTRGVMLYAIIVGGFLGGIAWLVMAVAKGWLGTIPMILITRIPVVGKCIRTMALARFSWTFAMALNAGVDARKSMSMALRSTHNRYFSSHREQIDQVIVQGQSFHESLRISGVFPKDFLDAFETAEISGTQSESLEQLAIYYQERAEAAAKVLTRVASFLVWMATAGIIIALIFQLLFTMILPSYNEAFDFLENG